MANPELELISNIVKTADFTKVRKDSITPDFFRTEEGGLVFEWLWKEFHHPSHRGEVPSVDRLLRKFPDFDYCPSRDSIDALIDELKETNLQSLAVEADGEERGVEHAGLAGRGDHALVVAHRMLAGEQLERVFADAERPVDLDHLVLDVEP